MFSLIFTLVLNSTNYIYFPKPTLKHQNEPNDDNEVTDLELNETKKKNKNKNQL